MATTKRRARNSQAAPEQSKPPGVGIPENAATDPQPAAKKVPAKEPARARAKCTPKKAAPKKTMPDPARPENPAGKSAFIRALQFIKPGISTGGGIVEQSDLVLMDGTRLVSFNDEVAVSHPFPIGHSGGISANELFKLFQKLPADDINISQTVDEDNRNQLTILCKNIEANFFIAVDITVPELGLNDDVEWLGLPDDFCDAISFCKNSAATDSAKGILTCINIIGDTVYGCDNLRATRKTLSEPLPDGIEMNIPVTAAKDLPAYAPTHFHKDDNWIHFKNANGTIYSTRTMSMEYPNVAGLFEEREGETGSKLTLPIELKEALERTEIMAEEREGSKNRTVTVSINGGEITCTGQSSVGRIVEKIKTGHKESMQFIIIPSMLCQILETVHDASVFENRIVFNGEHFAHVVGIISPEN